MCLNLNFWLSWTKVAFILNSYSFPIMEFGGMKSEKGHTELDREHALQTHIGDTHLDHTFREYIEILYLHLVN